MHPLLQRIVINGVLTAVFLAVIGAVIGQIGSVFMLSSQTNSAEPDAHNADAEIAHAIQYRMPLMLAGYGFIFVAIGEVILHFWRGRKPPTPAASAAQPQNTEQMLQELLAKAEAEENARSDAQAGGTRHRDMGGESIELKGGLPDLGGGHRGKGGESVEMDRPVFPPQPPPQPKKD
ncbi:MAG: hypothetical protein U0792_23150 [Gemmataceae bacterium]